MSFSFQIENNFKAVQNAIAENIETSLKAVGEYVKGEAKLRAPVGEYDDGRIGGRLRDSIDYETDMSQKAVHIGSDVEYAPYVELGTSKMEEQPYLTPAVAENPKNIEEIFARFLKNVGG